MKIRVIREVSEEFATYELQEKKWWGWKTFQEYPSKAEYDKFERLLKNFKISPKLEKVGDWKTRPEL